MIVDTKGFRKAHDEIRAHAAGVHDLASMLPQLTLSQRRRRQVELVETLRRRVEPHTKLDETLLFPALAERLGQPLIAASMNYDHLAIRHWISELEHVDPLDTARFQSLLYGLDALIRVHMWKEEELFLATLESGWLQARVT